MNNQTTYAEEQMSSALLAAKSRSADAHSATVEAWDALVAIQEGGTIPGPSTPEEAKCLQALLDAEHTLLLARTEEYDIEMAELGESLICPCCMWSCSDPDIICRKWHSVPSAYGYAIPTASYSYADLLGMVLQVRCEQDRQIAAHALEACDYVVAGSVDEWVAQQDLEGSLRDLQESRRRLRAYDLKYNGVSDICPTCYNAVFDERCTEDHPHVYETNLAVLTANSSYREIRQAQNRRFIYTRDL